MVQNRPLALCLGTGGDPSLGSPTLVAAGAKSKAETEPDGQAGLPTTVSVTVRAMVEPELRLGWPGLPAIGAAGIGSALLPSSGSKDASGRDQYD